MALNDDLEARMVHTKRRSRWVIAVLFLAVAIAIPLLLQETNTGRNRGEGALANHDQPTTALQQSQAAATAATPVAEATGTSGTSAASIDAELQRTIGGDAAPIGRRIELHFPAPADPTDAAFVVGTGDNATLMVFRRDTRSERARQQGLPPTHAIQVPRAGTMVRVTGTLQEVPRAEETYSWQLTPSERQALADRGFYIRVDEVAEEGVTE